jgi:uncharacterized membrane protein
MNAFSLCSMVLFFLATGLGHFLRPAPFLKITPAWVPYPKAVNLLAGGWECASALLLLSSRYHNLACCCLIALLVAVFPANLNMALHKEAGLGIKPLWLLARLPLQGLLIYWVWSQIAR